MVNGEYLPDEVKGIVSIFDMFIGNRLHSCIAATSMGIPTLALADVDKIIRVIGVMMGQEQYIVDTRNRVPEELLAEIKSKLDLLWDNRDNVTKVLKDKTQAARNHVMLYGKLIEEMIKSSKTSEP